MEAAQLGGRRNNMPATMMDLPDEVLLQVFVHLPVKSTLRLTRTSRRLGRIASSPWLWRVLCAADWQYWSECNADVQQRSSLPMAATNWMMLYYSRACQDKHIQDLLEGTVRNERLRMHRLRLIVQNGYESKDTLMRNWHVGNEDEYALAKQYFSREAVGQIQRDQALQWWTGLRQGGIRSLERGLLCFNYFGLAPSDEDMDTWVREMDRTADAYRQQFPNELPMSTRERVAKLASWLVDRGLATPDAENGDVERGVLGGQVVMQHCTGVTPYQCLRTIAIVNFCRLASRFGVNAWPLITACGLQQIVHVLPPVGVDCDDQPLEPESKAQPIYLDPAERFAEITAERAFSLMQRTGGRPILGFTAVGNPGAYSQPPLSWPPRRTPSSLIILHVALGMKSVVEGIRHEADLMRILCRANYRSLTQGTHYASLWAILIIGGHHQLTVERVGTSMAIVLKDIYKELSKRFREDASLVMDHDIPGMENVPRFYELLRLVLPHDDEDQKPVTPRRRTPEINAIVQHRVGQIFRHRRYGYVGYIIAWDLRTTMNEQWEEHMNIEELLDGPKKAYYRAVGEDNSRRYVLQDNMEILHPDQPSEALLLQAGRYFKRWDAQRRRFVSNVNTFPDD